VVQLRDAASVGRSKAGVPSLLVLRDLIVALRAVLEEDGVRRCSEQISLATCDLLSGRVALLTAESAAYLPVSGIDP
jgi:hypothetical protein